MAKKKAAPVETPVEIKEEDVQNQRECFVCGVRINTVQHRHNNKLFCGVPCYNKHVK